jgi:hypothetical protein
MMFRGRFRLAVVILMLMTGCSTIGVTDWALVAVDGRTIELTVEIGNGTCHSLDEVVLDETTTEVNVTAHRRWHEDRPCTLDRNAERVIVGLDRPLGDRELTGCDAAGTLDRLAGGDQRSCRETMPAE